MKHFAKILVEFLKQARKWNDLSYDEQREYLYKHRKTKHHLTAKPENFESWVPGRKFLNLETKQQSSFDQLPQVQQEAIKKQFEHEKETYQQPEPEAKVERQKKFLITGKAGKEDIVRADNEKDAMIKYFMQHENYDEEHAKSLVEKEEPKTQDNITQIGDYSIKPLSKQKKERVPRAERQLSERKVRRMSRRLVRDLHVSGKLNDESLAQAAKDTLDKNTKLKDFFKSKGIEDDKMTQSFVDFIKSNTKSKKPITERRVARIGRKLRRALGDKKINDDVAYKLSKAALTKMPALKSYFKQKGVSDRNVTAAFADYIYKVDNATAIISDKKVILGGKKFQTLDDGTLVTKIGGEKQFAKIYVTFTDTKTNFQVPVSRITGNKGRYIADVSGKDNNLSDDAANRAFYKMGIIAKEVEELTGVKTTMGDLI
jgi:hypothetical protein